MATTVFAPKADAVPFRGTHVNRCTIAQLVQPHQIAWHSDPSNIVTKLDAKTLDFLGRSIVTWVPIGNNIECVLYFYGKTVLKEAVDGTVTELRATVHPEITLTLPNGGKKPYAIAIAAHEVIEQTPNGPTIVIYLDRVLSDHAGEFVQPPHVHNARIADMIRMTTFADVPGRNKIILNKTWRGSVAEAKTVWDTRDTCAHRVAGLRFESTAVPYNRGDDMFWFPPQTTTAPGVKRMDFAHDPQPTIEELSAAIRAHLASTSVGEGDADADVDSAMHEASTPREAHASPVGDDPNDDPSVEWD